MHVAITDLSSVIRADDSRNRYIIKFNVSYWNPMEHDIDGALGSSNDPPINLFFEDIYSLYNESLRIIYEIGLGTMVYNCPCIIESGLTEISSQVFIIVESKPSGVYNTSIVPFGRYKLQPDTDLIHRVVILYEYNAYLTVNSSGQFASYDTIPPDYGLSYEIFTEPPIPVKKRTVLVILTGLLIILMIFERKNINSKLKRLFRRHTGTITDELYPKNNVD
ncbi:MAG: hypothetical protein ACW99Q_27235 [Candidatus Kariarchaeaceae archaeon]